MHVSHKSESYGAAVQFDWLFLNRAVNSPPDCDTTSLTNTLLYDDIIYADTDLEDGARIQPHVHMRHFQSQSVDTFPGVDSSVIDFRPPLQNPKRLFRLIAPLRPGKTHTGVSHLS